jgi:hypothetical protein
MMLRLRGPLRSVVALWCASSMAACSGRCSASRAAVNGSKAPADLAQQEPGLSTGRILEPLRRAEGEFRSAAIDGAQSGPPTAVNDRLEFVLKALRQERDRLPRDTFDVNVVVAQAGSEPTGLLNWVRERTRLVPYSGSLRGAGGVLMDRFGNSLDRAQLLAELLRRTGSEVRLAQATLSPDRARLLLQHIEAKGAGSRHPTDDIDADQALLDRFATRFGADRVLLAAKSRAVREAGLKASRAIARRAAAQGDALLALLTAFKENVEDPEPAFLRALQDHWWVQRRVGDEWVDADPLGLAGPEGSDHLSAARVVVPAQLDDALTHRVVIRMVIECACGGGLQERTVLEHNVRLNEAAGQSLIIQQVPFGGAQPDMASLLDGNAAAMKQWVAGHAEWLPVLTVGPTQVIGSRFNRNGDVLAAGALSFAPAATGILDAFGGGEESPPGQLIAEYIDYELHVPGRPVQIERRTLFDWMRRAERPRRDAQAPLTREWDARALDLMTLTEVLLLSSQPSPQFVADMLYTAIDPKPSQSPGSDTVGVPSALELYAFALSRMMWSTDRERLFLGAPNVLTRHQGIREDPGGVAGWAAFDVVANTVDVLPGGNGDRRAMRVRQGVLDTNVESFLAAAAGGATNISEFSIETSGWNVRSARPDGVNQAEGALVFVAPALGNEAALAAGWWQIDPKTGTALGMTRNGWGGTPTAETTTNTNSTAIRNARVLAEFGKMLLCWVSINAKALAQDIEAGRRGTRVNHSSDQFYYLMCTLGSGASGVGIITGAGIASFMGQGVSIVVSGLQLYQTMAALKSLSK